MSSRPVDSELGRLLGHTLPGRVAVFAHHWPNRVALREKHRGLWRETTWLQYQQNMMAVADSLAAWGLKTGDRVAILSDNRPEWLYADLGAQALGVLAAGIYTTNPPADVAYVLNHCRAKVIFCEDQEQVDKVLDWTEPLPNLQHIVVMETAGTQSYTDARLITWEQFIAPGLERTRELQSAHLHGRLQALDDKVPAVIVYTSGTTAQPKGALLTAHSMLSLSSVYLDQIGGGPDDSLLSYLPLCHVAEKIFTQFTPLSCGAVVHFGESLETVRQDLVEVAPTIFLGVPRIWEKIHSGIEVGIRNSSPEKRALFRWAMKVARRSQAAGGKRGLLWQLANVLVLRSLRERMGLSRCRFSVSGAAPIAPELLRDFHALGIEILEGWGLSESCGLSHLNLPGLCRIGTVGQPVEGVECRLSEAGEVQIRGPHIFAGYLDNEQATREAVDPEGWLHTGDLGSIDADGYLTITGRMKEILINAGGKNLSPVKIENALKTSAYIKEAAAVADGRAYTTALIQIDPDMVGDWATRRGLAFTSFEDLSANAEVRKLISAEVRRINDEMLARVEQVRGFQLLPKELNQDDGEVTATQKLKRRVVYEKFSGLIEDMYRRGEAA